MWLLIIKIPKGFFPQQDTGALVGGVRGPQDSSFPAMNNSILQLANVIKADPAVAECARLYRRRGATNGGFIFIALKPLQRAKDQRSQTLSTGCGPS